jgi:CRISPR-associated endonuclease Csn1
MALMKNILGLDLGTNSIGWAIRDLEIDSSMNQIVDYGVKIFEDALTNTQTGLILNNSEKQKSRRARIQTRRKKRRKVLTLKWLINNGLCPLTMDELRQWASPKKKSEMKYPANPEFINWIRLDFDQDGVLDYTNVYELRVKALDETISKYELGRILYHYAQRRGFLSNRKDATVETDDENTKKKKEPKEGDEADLGAIKNSVEKFKKLSAEKGALSVVFKERLDSGEKVRGNHFGRKELEAEFRTIMQKQVIDEERTNEIFKYIFVPRPLKSQKHTIGLCTFEKKKPRCPISHFYFEEYQKLQFINNIRIKSGDNSDSALYADQVFDFRPLNQAEREKIDDLFYRKSSPSFDFVEIMNKIEDVKKAKAKNYKYRYVYNYKATQVVKGCHTCASIINAIGVEKWNSLKDESQKNSNAERALAPNEAGKGEISKHDLWNVLFSFADADKIVEFAINKMGLTQEAAIKLSKVNLKQDYAALSLKAIKKILPFLRKGLIFSHAVFLANMEEVIGKENWRLYKDEISDELSALIRYSHEYKKLIENINGNIQIFNDTRRMNSDRSYINKDDEINNLNNILDKLCKDLDTDFPDKLLGDIRNQINNNVKDIKIEFLHPETTDSIIVDYLNNKFSLTKKELDKLYHPSDIDVFPPLQKYKVPGTEKEILLLPLPKLKAIRNPIFNRAMHALRQLLNYLILNGKIDRHTHVYIEFAREYNTVNYRNAIESYQRDRERENLAYRKEIENLFLTETGHEYNATSDDILKYRLWEEQERQCLYTDKEISLSELFIESKFDIDHTIPRSLVLDNSIENKTLCDSDFNRNIKKNRIPAQLSNYEAVLNKVTSLYQPQIDALEKRMKNIPMGETKESRDQGVRQKTKAKLQRDYYRDKLKTFKVQKADQNFRPSQGVDTALINKYSKIFLSKYFDRVDSKGARVADLLKRFWKIIPENEKKKRTLHSHHAIDAIVMTYTTKSRYESLQVEYKKIEKDNNKILKEEEANYPPPFPGFKDFILDVRESIVVSNEVRDRALRNTKRILLKNGVKQFKYLYEKDESGDYILDENGRKIHIYKTNSDGTYALDKRGNQIKLYELDSAGNKIPLYSTGSGLRAPLFKDRFYGKIKHHGEEKFVERKAFNFNNFKSMDSLQAIVDSNLKIVIIQQLEKYIREGETFAQAMTHQLYQNLEKQIPIKKVRVVTGEKKLLKVKQHLMTSDRESADYKRHLYSKNDGNYMAIIYDKTKETKSGKKIHNRFYTIITNQELAKRKAAFDKVGKVFDLSDYLPDDECELFGAIKQGAIVMFYENSPEEIHWGKEYSNEQSKRLYKVIGISADNRIRFKRLLDARNEEALKQELISKFGNDYEKTLITGISKYRLHHPHTFLRLTPNNFNFLIHKVHFTINPDGTVKKII